LGRAKSGDETLRTDQDWTTQCVLVLDLYVFLTHCAQLSLLQRG